MVAIVMMDSFLQGFDGYVNLTSKTNGVEHFYQQLGAEEFGQNMIFDQLHSQIVIDRFPPKGGRIKWTLHK